MSEAVQEEGQDSSQRQQRPPKREFAREQLAQQEGRQSPYELGRQPTHHTESEKKTAVRELDTTLVLGSIRFLDHTLSAPSRSKRGAVREFWLFCLEAALVVLIRL